MEEQEEASVSHQEVMQECCQAVSGLLSYLSLPLEKGLAAMLLGVVKGQSVVLSDASAEIPGCIQNRSKQRRLQRLIANDRLEVHKAQRYILRRMLQARHGRVDLFLDASTTGATAHQAGTVTLCVAIGRRGRALPLVWRTFTADEPGQDWKRTIRELFEVVQSELPPDVQVVLMADRGLSGGPLGRLAQDLGWYYVLRVQSGTRVQQADESIQTIAELAPKPETSCFLAQVRVWPPRKKGTHWVSFWDDATVANVVAVWREGDSEPWLLVTNLPANQSRCNDYRRRTWEEELFRDLKSFGWNWQRSRVRDPRRVERLLLVMALATLWMLVLSQRVIRAGRRRLLEEHSRRCYSWFQLGIRWLKYCLVNDQPIHCCLQPWSERAAPVKLS